MFCFLRAAVTGLTLPPRSEDRAVLRKGVIDLKADIVCLCV
jgi:hypothetical protein